MSKITFSRQERDVLIPTVQAWFRDELDHDLSGLQADMLIDFIGREMGPAFYNRALYDAQALIAAQAETLADAVLGLEKHPPKDR